MLVWDPWIASCSKIVGRTEVERHSSDFFENLYMIVGEHFRIKQLLVSCFVTRPPEPVRLLRQKPDHFFDRSIW